MMPWFLRDSERLELERAGIDGLSRSAPWLVGTEWRLDGELCLDAVIRAHSHDYEVRVSFPAMYPDAPAVVRPRNTDRRLSSHQYGGPNGPLCLEWGPDNWHRDVTAVQLLESTYRLFDTENPLGENRPEVPVVAPSRHRLTAGQELRGERFRWYVRKALADFIAAQSPCSVGGFKFSFRRAGETWVVLVHEATPPAGAAWKDDRIPTNLPSAQPENLDVGVWFKTDIEWESMGQPRTAAELGSLLKDLEGPKFLATDGSSPVAGFGGPIAGVLVSGRSGDLHFFVMLSGQTVVACSKVQSDDTPAQARSPECDELSNKTIGVVGLGSAGSKIAISLARMGVRRFYLVDHDVLLPENLQRHALDWQGVLLHKADAVTEAVRLVAPGAQIDVCRLHITGQESNAAVSGALSKLSACDLIVDATADPRVFNFVAAIARTANRPMVWMEVFGGGGGGLVARCRPGVEPTPQDMRGAYLQFCTANPDSASRPAPGRYATETEEGEVLVASDADVAVIAHHAARFVPDCFVPPERSRFPYSMYLVGMAKGWVFEAPFAAIPISMASFSTAGWKDTKEPNLTSDNVDFLVGLLAKNENATPGTPRNNPASG